MGDIGRTAPAVAGCMLDQVRRDDALGGGGDQHARQGRLRLAHLERLEHGPAARELAAHALETVVAAGGRRITPEVGPKRRIHQQPLEQVGGAAVVVCLLRRHSWTRRSRWASGMPIVSTSGRNSTAVKSPSPINTNSRWWVTATSTGS